MSRYENHRLASDCIGEMALSRFNRDNKTLDRGSVEYLDALHEWAWAEGMKWPATSPARSGLLVLSVNAMREARTIRAAAREAAKMLEAKR